MSNSYRMVNPSNGASVTTTEPYLLHWIARGFDVVEIIIESEESSEEEELVY